MDRIFVGATYTMTPSFPSFPVLGPLTRRSESLKVCVDTSAGRVDVHIDQTERGDPVRREPTLGTFCTNRITPSL